MRRNGTAELEPKSEFTDDERKQLLETTIKKNEKVAESGIEMAKLFLHKEKRQIANRRLHEIVEDLAEQRQQKKRSLY